jgi:hypothetical protein
MKAYQTILYFILLWTFVDLTDTNIHYMLENSRTNEILLVEVMNLYGPSSPQGGISISRHPPMGTPDKLITEMSHVYEWERNMNVGKSKLTLGIIQFDYTFL